MNVSDKHFISTVGSVPRSSKKSYRVWVLLLTRTAKRSEARYHNNSVRVEASPVVEENLTESVVAHFQYHFRLVDYQGCPSNPNPALQYREQDIPLQAKW